eukprot:TRINITY_DN1223_c0_g1_i1.p1 TRINITY_DN1223_c0_g1~~TRINITY_DN1223_c0_g1_i1.p1  ORF type:complete len:1266 (+),score=410.12 TRINITY_DN1223_c0_g1_i1:83-3880(+)
MEIGKIYGVEAISQSLRSISFLTYNNNEKMGSTAYLLVLVSIIAFNLAYSDELTALRELYDSTGGPSWKNSKGWNGTNPCQGFYGVTCGGDGRVKTIDLKSNNLVGSIPDSIGELKMMTDLALGDNLLSGAIPRSISQCNELLRLSLTSNRLSGTLPDFPPSLSLLAVDENSIGGPIPDSLANLEGLVTLALTDNRLTSFPTSLSKLGSLAGIYMSNNPITADLGVILPQLTGVTSFFAENCNLTGNFPDISGLKSITRLYLNNNFISGELPSNIGSSSILSRFRLGNNRMSGFIPASISNLKSITELDLSGNFFRGVEGAVRPSSLSSCSMGNNLMRCPIPSWASTCLAVCDVTSNATVDPTNVLSEMQRIFQQKSTVFNIILTPGTYNSIGLSINRNGYEVVRLLSRTSESVLFTSTPVTVSNVNQFYIDGIQMTESSVTLSKISTVYISKSKFTGSSTINLATQIGSASVILSQFSEGNLKEMISVRGTMQNLTVGMCDFTRNSVTSISVTSEVQSINLYSLKFSYNGGTNVLITGRNPQFSLSSSDFSNNFASNLDISNSNSVYISSSTFTSNSNFSAVVFRSGVNQVRIINSKWTSNSRGGISLDSSSFLSLFQTESSDFVGNYGAIRVDGICSSFSVSYSTFANNFGESDGGAIYLSSSSFSSFNSVSFDGNTAARGGAIFSQGNSMMQNVQFRNNSAQTGGALHLLVSGNCQLVLCNFDANRAEKEGGGMFLETSESILVSDAKREVKFIEMKQVSFSNNYAANTGGGIRIYNVHGGSAQVIISDSSLFKNSASQGSSISINGSFSLSSTTFKDNSNPQNSIAVLSNGNIVMGDGNQFGDNSIWVSSEALETKFSYSSAVPVVCQSGVIVPNQDGFKVCGDAVVSNKENGENTNIIPIAVGAAVGGVVLLFLIAVVAFIVLKRKNRSRGQPSFNFTLDMSQIAKEVVIDENDLKNIERVGEGAFGVVSKADWRKLQVAVKQMNYESSMGEKELRDFLAEVNLLHGLRSHPNVVLFIGIVIPPQTLSLVTEFCHGGSLYKYLQLHHKTTSMEQMKMWITGIALGLLHLHSEGIIHRDLAARNVLLTKNLDAKVCDFGLSRKQLSADDSGKTVSDVGPIKWMPPEAIKEQIYGPKTDVYSFGILIFEILSGEEPYQGIPPLQVAVSVSTQGIRPTLPPSVDPTSSLAKLMCRCWNTDPAQRPSFVDICEQLTSKTPVDTVRTLQVSQSQLARARDGAEIVYSSILAPQLSEAQTLYSNNV